MTMMIMVELTRCPQCDDQQRKVRLMMMVLIIVDNINDKEKYLANKRTVSQQPFTSRPSLSTRSGMMMIYIQ